jgi:tetratricopeptide (TPR) repeat protein
MSVSRNAPCPCGSGKKYKKCCMAQDEKAAAEARHQRQETETRQREKRRAEEADLVQYAAALDQLSNQANDHILAGQWDQAEACCRQLLERFPQQIDGHHRFYEYYKARADYPQAKAHAEATLAMVESQDGFDPDFSAEIKEDIAAFDRHLQANPPLD